MSRPTMKAVRAPVGDSDLRRYPWTLSAVANVRGNAGQVIASGGEGTRRTGVRAVIYVTDGFVDAATWAIEYVPLG
jgi:hypothetical protein